MSIKFPLVLLGPEMVAPILWAPGIFWFFLLENPHAHKIPPFRGGVRKGTVAPKLATFRSAGGDSRRSRKAGLCCVIFRDWTWLIDHAVLNEEILARFHLEMLCRLERFRILSLTLLQTRGDCRPQVAQNLGCCFRANSVCGRVQFLGLFGTTRWLCSLTVMYAVIGSSLHFNVSIACSRVNTCKSSYGKRHGRRSR